ncbi:MAG: glycerol-3-phosphate 1-O-acyltransferase PlsY [Betaproteobacteria bacterium]|nr:glycerol-3-phosphate 1-O-acyltransferase PlsY [Betaproteobacteria bacterium]
MAGNTALAVLAAYLIGSLSFAVIVSRLMGLADPRTFGSKNPGATNVLRSGNKVAAVITLLLDAAKGWLPVYLVLRYGAPYGLDESAQAVVGLTAFLGHLFPVFFRFAGGKGVATAAGVVLATNPWLGLAAGLSWLIIAYFFRYSSLASVVASVFAPVYYLFGDGLAWRADNGVALALALMSALLVWRHGPNIARLVAGTESRIGGGSSGGVKGR